MSLPLAGTRVLDLTNVIAGPLASYLLALMGAEVIKVEVPGIGDLSRKMGADPAMGRQQMGASYLAFNAGKKSITLNLKSARGKDLFRKLCLDADVVLENFRPGAMQRLGLGAEDVACVEPRADLLRRLRVRSDRTFGATCQLRPDHPGLLRVDGADRRARHRTCEGGSCGVRYYSGDHRRLRHCLGVGQAQRHRRR